ncbi:MAG TPA: alpha/beta fold hydrolase [Coriobacteriia bacterium]|nr:alpha/beta fold hydrolase [Coriobacteriia bacterium]
MSATSGQLERGDTAIHWWLEGSDGNAPLIVFTHGGAMDHRMWDAQVAAFKGEYRVLTYDVRGHGASKCPAETMSLESCRDDLLALMDQAGAERAVLVGHSVGATISQLAAVKSPQRVTALIGIGAVCATIAPPFAAKLRQAINPIALKLLGQQKLRQMFAEMAGVTPEVQAYARDAITALTDGAFESVMRTGFGAGYAADPSYKLNAPLLLLRGDHEPYTAFMGAARQWLERDAATEIVVPNAAHNANQDAPDFVNERIREFLAL